MRLPLWLLLLLLTFNLSPASAATLAEFTFDSPEKALEFRHLTEQLRCLVCQNESLAASNAELAQDLRQEVYEMMKAGKSKEEIVQFMVARYGDFVLFNPPLKPSTYPLWFGPFVLLGIASFLLIRTLQRKRKAPEPELSEAERNRIQQLTRSDDKRRGVSR